MYRGLALSALRFPRANALVRHRRDLCRILRDLLGIRVTLLLRLPMEIRNTLLLRNSKGIRDTLLLRLFMGTRTTHPPRLLQIILLLRLPMAIRATLLLRLPVDTRVSHLRKDQPGIRLSTLLPGLSISIDQIILPVLLHLVSHNNHTTVRQEVTTRHPLLTLPGNGVHLSVLRRLRLSIQHRLRLAMHALRRRLTGARILLQARTGLIQCRQVLGGLHSTLITRPLPVTTMHTVPTTIRPIDQALVLLRVFLQGPVTPATILGDQVGRFRIPSLGESPSQGLQRAQ